MARSPTTLIPIADAIGPAAAHAIASALRDAGIEAFVFDTAKATLQWEAPRVIAPYQVHVARVDAEAAHAVIQTTREESIDIDWNEVDLGQPEDPTSAALSRSNLATWNPDSARHARPRRDRVFGLTKFGIIAWIFGSAAAAIATAVYTIVQTFFAKHP